MTGTNDSHAWKCNVCKTKSAATVLYYKKHKRRSSTENMQARAYMRCPCEYMDGKRSRATNYHSRQIDRTFTSISHIGISGPNLQLRSSLTMANERRNVTIITGTPSHGRITASVVTKLVKKLKIFSPDWKCCDSDPSHMTWTVPSKVKKIFEYWTILFSNGSM